MELGYFLESTVPGGGYPRWIQTTFDQRNSVVVGTALGFAVIPTIFTIAADAFSGVPRHLVAGSLALGASPGQTALRIVLPTAGSGIVSTVLLGFTRAAGETIIVLMATGNTPTLSLWPYVGFRSLTTDIAVEIPCCPEGDTLWGVLSLSALLLFGATLAVNILAELIRVRLRKKYQGL
ncbi:MAG TPA: ABC transporter permease subunit [Planctomycetota bacterium]|nr:ABC transporter permease subunit [Planctomycetota bacterium]